jgi:hypothetical protein
MTEREIMSWNCFSSSTRLDINAELQALSLGLEGDQGNHYPVSGDLQRDEDGAVGRPEHPLEGCLRKGSLGSCFKVSSKLKTFKMEIIPCLI